ncbi:MAG: recombinase family protein [Ruminococcus flavefaciens]|nr:recombinase family protein [Ruminococcus flavefaciens]
MARKSRVDTLNKVVVEEKVVLAGEYGRLSVEDGDDIEQNSIGNQQKIVLHYLDEHPEIKLVDTYYDNGYTGMNYNRPGFTKMLRDLKTGRINCVIVKDVSRLGRHFVMTSEFVEQTFPEMGVRLICINDSYDSSDVNADASALTLPLKMVMNDYYVKDISNKIRSSISAKMEIGEYIPSSSSISYGYIRNPKFATYDIDSETAEVVREIYRLRAQGTSFTKIACILNAKNIPSPGKIRFLRGLTKAEKYENAVWCRRTISKICSDQVYIGNRVHGTVKSDKVGLDKKRRSKDEWKIIENAHPAIISEELYEKVQKININESQRRKGFEQRAGFDEDYRELFRGKIFCAECHSVMSARKGCARRDAKTPSRIFYDCNNYVESSRMQCASHYIRQETLLKAITDTLNQQVKMAVDIELLTEKLKNMPKVISYQNEAKSRYQSVFLKRKNMEGKIEQLLIDLTQNIINRSEYDYMKKQYTQAYNELLQEETQALSDMRAKDAALSVTDKWLDAMKKYQELPVIDRTLLKLLVERIEVNKDKKIKIILNYKDPYRPILEFLNRVEVMRDVS